MKPSGPNPWVWIYLVLSVVATMNVAGRTLAGKGSLGHNDYTRWATVRVLVEKGTFAIGERVEKPDGSHKDRGFVQSIDKMLDPETGKFYASKPPLVSTIAAGVYWVVKHSLGWTFKTAGFYVVRCILIIINTVPFGIYLLLMALLIHRRAQSDFARIVTFATAAFGTTLTSFSVTLSNHPLATTGCLFCVVTLERALSKEDGRFWTFLLCGLFSGWVAALEIPAIGFVGLTGFVVWLRDRKKTLLGFVPGALIPLTAAAVSSHLAVGHPFFFYLNSIRHKWVHFPGSFWDNPTNELMYRDLSYVLHFFIGHHGAFSLSPILLLFPLGAATILAPGRSLAWQAKATAIGLLVYTLALLAMRWISLPGLRYPLSVTLPIFVISAVGVMVWRWGWWRDADRLQAESTARLALATTIPVIAFYIVWTHNFGGVTSGPRWLMWLLPLWLLCLPKAIDSLPNKPWIRVLVLMALAVSVLTVSYPAANPWVRPLWYPEALP